MHHLFKDEDTSSFNQLVNLSIIHLKGRTFDDLNKTESSVVIEMLSGINNFAELHTELGEKGLIKIAKCLNLKFYKAKTTILNNEEEIKNFYIILKGQVEVLCDISDLKEEQRELILTKKLKQGQCFGDVELSTRTPNKSTYNCLTDCILLQMIKYDFNQLLNLIESEKANKFTHYLRGFDVFKQVPRLIMLRFSKLMEKKSCVRNETVYKEGDNIDGIYFIRNGEFLVTKKKIVDDLYNMKKIENDIKILKREGEILIQGLSGQISVNSNYFQSMQKHLDKQKIEDNNNNEKNFKINSTKGYDLVILKDNELFGEIEIFLSCGQKRTFGVTCKTDTAECFFIPYDKFIEAMTPELISNFKIWCKKKSEFYYLRYKNGKEAKNLTFAIDQITPLHKIERDKLETKNNVPFKRIYRYNNNSVFTYKNVDRVNDKDQRSNSFLNSFHQFNSPSSFYSVNEPKSNNSIRHVNHINHIPTVNPVNKTHKKFKHGSFSNFIELQMNYTENINTDMHCNACNTKSYFIEDKLKKSFTYKALVNVTSNSNFNKSYNYENKTEQNISLGNTIKNKYGLKPSNKSELLTRVQTMIKLKSYKPKIKETSNLLPQMNGAMSSSYVNTRESMMKTSNIKKPREELCKTNTNSTIGLKQENNFSKFIKLGKIIKKY